MCYFFFKYSSVLSFSWNCACGVVEWTWVLVPEDAVNKPDDDEEAMLRHKFPPTLHPLSLTSQSRERESGVRVREFGRQVEKPAVTDIDRGTSEVNVAHPGAVASVNFVLTRSFL